ncbi:MAG: methyltransferase domain-containing protein [Candidatus Latescibacterota bacterium]|nr:MAG: methyltransferase domain-containing protein [Candidatus Latescibacterota bacterium]
MPQVTRTWLALAAIVMICASPLRAQHDHGREERGHADHATSQHRFDDVGAWEARFEDPQRDAWQLPDSVVSILVDRADLVVADIGSATGYFPVRFARELPRGLVIGADIEPEMVFYLNDRARREGLQNLVSVLAAADDPHFPRAVDLVFICNTYHHIDDRVAYFERLQQQLREGARVAIVDYRLDSRRGPAHKLSPEVVEREMQAAGFELAHSYDFLPEQYFLVFRLVERD